MTQARKNGEIWLANLNPNKEIEPGKTRPVLILQSQTLLNLEHPSTVIIPLTSQLTENTYPLRIRVDAQDKLTKSSDLLLDQIRAIDNKRLTQGPLTRLSQEKMILVHQAIDSITGSYEYESTPLPNFA